MPRTYLWRARLLILLFCGCGASAYGQPAASVNIEDLRHALLDGRAEYVLSAAEVTLEEARARRFQQLRREDINRGITAQTVWVRVRLENPGAEPKTWVLHHETSYLDNITVHAADNDGSVTETRLSDRRPFSERPVAYRKLAYAHTTPSGGHTDLYLRLSFDKADSMTLRFHLWERDRFNAAVAEENLVHGAYYGIMLALMIIALAGALVMRSAIYFYYLAFLATNALLWAILSGYAYQYLWPQSVFWHNEGFHVFFLLFPLATLQFSKAFLKTRLCCPRIHPWLSGLQLVMLAGIALRFAGLYLPVLIISFAALSVLVLLPLLGWLAYREGLRYARWYSAAWLVYSAGLVVSVLSAGTELLSWGMTPLAYAQAASLLEAMLLLAALAERLKHWDVDRQEALRLANYDSLTGLGNRRLLTQSLGVFTERFARNGLSVYLLMIDLDHFKRINDEYGHDAGDAVLCAFARLLQRSSRAQDVCVRYGGEEFAVLFQAATVDNALRVAERIRTAFAETATEYRGQSIPHTLSSGLALVLSEREELNAREMMARADAALYSAKSAGRNRTRMYEPGAPEPVPSTPAEPEVSA